jgi:hypothetical protein
MYRVPQIYPYNREKAVQYAHKWALGRNPNYYNFENIGGDCTNFASQVIFAGSGIMNYTQTFGWYYANSYNRTPSWTGVDYLHNFLTSNKSIGPFAEIVNVRDIKIGDIIQLSFQDGPRFNHSPVVVSTGFPVDFSNILVAAHTDDWDYYPITEYGWEKVRCIHIIGVRK